MQRIGSRAQVMHGNAKMTGGGLRKKDLKYNKHGKIVSKKMSQRAKKEKRLQKAGYITKKGQFGAINIEGGMFDINFDSNKIWKNFGRSYSGHYEEPVRSTYIEITTNSRNKDFDKQINTCNFFKEISNRNIVTPNTTTNTTNYIPMPKHITIKERIFGEEQDNRIKEGNGSTGEVKKYINEKVPVLEIAVKKKTLDMNNYNNNTDKYRKIKHKNATKLHKYLIPFLIYDTLFIMPLGYNLSIFETKTRISLELDQKKQILKKIMYDINELSKVGYYYIKLKIEHIILIATKQKQTRNDIFKYEITPYLSGLKEINHRMEVLPTSFFKRFRTNFEMLCIKLNLTLTLNFKNSDYTNFKTFYEKTIDIIDALSIYTPWLSSKHYNISVKKDSDLNNYFKTQVNTSKFFSENLSNKLSKIKDNDSVIEINKKKFEINKKKFNISNAGRIGEGKFSIIHKYVYRNNNNKELLAIAIKKKKKKELEILKNISIASTIPIDLHKYIIPFRILNDLFIMPSGMDLINFLKKFINYYPPTKFSIFILKKIITDIKCLYEAGYYYTDLKPENIILIATNKIKKEEINNEYEITPYLGDLGSISTDNTTDNTTYTTTSIYATLNNGNIPKKKEDIIKNTIINTISALKIQIENINTDNNNKNNTDESKEFVKFCEKILKKLDIYLISLQ